MEAGSVFSSSHAWGAGLGDACLAGGRATPVNPQPGSSPSARSAELWLRRCRRPGGFALGIETLLQHRGRPCRVCSSNNLSFADVRCRVSRQGCMTLALELTRSVPSRAEVSDCAWSWPSPRRPTACDLNGGHPPCSCPSSLSCGPSSRLLRERHAGQGPCGSSLCCSTWAQVVSDPVDPTLHRPARCCGDPDRRGRHSIGLLLGCRDRCVTEMLDGGLCPSPTPFTRQGITEGLTLAGAVSACCSFQSRPIRVPRCPTASVPWLIRASEELCLRGPVTFGGRRPCC